MEEHKENLIIRKIIEKLTDGIIFIGTIAMVFVISFTLLCTFFENWRINLIVLTILYVLYKWLGIVLTGITFFGIILIILLAPILFS